jgi:hypothetical protein
MLASVSNEVFMRFSFSFVVLQPYSKGERPPCLTLNRPWLQLWANGKVAVVRL